MKLLKSICVGGKVVPAGTDLQFVNGQAAFENMLIEEHAIPNGALEAEGSRIAEDIIAEVNDRWPDGFTDKEVTDTWPDKWGKKWQYALLDVDGEHVLMLRTESEAIEIYLFETDDHKFKPNGEYHVASDSRQSAAIEAIVSLKTKGTLAIDALVSMLYTVIHSCPPEDRPKLKKVMNAAYKAMNSADSSKVFRKELKLDKLQ